MPTVRSYLRAVPHARDDNDLRQPRLDRVADAERLPGGLPLRARAPGARRRRDRGRLRAGQRPPGACQPPHGPGPGQRGGRHLQRAGESSPAGDHRRPAGPASDHDRGEPDQPRCDPGSPAVRQVEPRAAACPGRAGGAGARDPPGDAPSARPGVRFDPDGRLERRGRRGPHATRARPEQAVALAEAQRLPVWATPATGGGRLGFPEDHPHFVGVLPPAIAAISQTLAGHDLILVVGSSVCPYYPYRPGPLLPEGAELVLITPDPSEAARAPMGEAIVGDVALALSALGVLAGESDREPPRARPAPGEPTPSDEPGRLSGSEAMAALAEAWVPEAIAVVEIPSSTLALRNRLRISRPGSYFFSASGGLGFGIAAAIGVQLAQPERPVVCVLGEGSAQYGITALWTAAAYRLPVTFLVLDNREYMILKWFASLEQVAGAPGLDLPGLDVAAVARAYGVTARTLTAREQLVEALREDISAEDGPRLIQVPVASGMWLE